MNASKPIEIFRAGSHVDNSGRRLSFSRGDVEAIAAAYDPSEFAAPIVVGHPKTNDPAFGWVKALKVRADGVLVAEPEKVEPEFAEAVRAGRYRKVSASFYLPDHPGNPAPGQYYLRHVGFLGAAAPAVKGLAAVELDEKEEKIVTFDGNRQLATGNGDRGVLARLFASLSELVSGPDGDPEEDGFAETDLTRQLNAALDASVDEDTTRRQLIDRAASRASVAAGTVRAILRGDIPASKDDPIVFNIARTFGLTLSPAPAGFSDNSEPGREGGQTKKEDALSESEKERFAALQTENAALKAKAAAFNEAEKTARKKDDAAFVAGLVKEGKLAPALSGDVVSFMQALDADKTVSFSEGTEKTPRDFFRALLSKAGTVIDLSERSAGEGDAAAKPQPLEERMAAKFKPAG